METQSNCGSHLCNHACLENLPDTVCQVPCPAPQTEEVLKTWLSLLVLFLFLLWARLPDGCYIPVCGFFHIHYLMKSLQDTGHVNINPILQVSKLRFREGNFPIRTYLEVFVFASVAEVYPYETPIILFKSF